MYGMIVDGEGKKMFKLIGNMIDLKDFVNQYGIEILCLWIVSVDYIEDLWILDEIIKGVVENYCCLCNMMCYLFGVLYQFDLLEMVLCSEMFSFEIWVLY